MSMTVFDQGAVRAYGKACEESPTYAELMRTVARRMAAGFYGEDYVDRFFQKHYSPETFTPEEAHCFSCAHSMCLTGEIAVASIEVGCSPLKDAAIEGNNERLSDLPPPFRAEFYGGKGDCDGFLRWDAPIEGSMLRLAEDRSGLEQWEIAIAPGQVVLEVGTTSAARTLAHLRMDRGLARWPYGFDKIWLFVSSNHRSFGQAISTPIPLPRPAN